MTAPRASAGGEPALTLLTIDLGTSAIKAALWAPGGVVALERAPLVTTHPRPGWSEQDPEDWWDAVVSACVRIKAAAPSALASVAAIGLCGARETFVPVTGDLDPLGPAIVWSDRRADAEAARLVTDLGGIGHLRDRLGIVVDAGSVVAKLAWLARHEPARMDRSRWVVTPRDLVAAHLTGEVATDVTMASRTGLVTLAGEPAPETSSLARGRLPPALASSAVLGPCRPEAAAPLGVRGGLPVIMGAGDRACEAIGTGAGPERPVVAWGSTANLSTPVETLAEQLPPAVAVSAGALGGYLLEAGLSASGAALDWLAALTGADISSLISEAWASGIGARGVLALPWLNGARAPWWRPGARGAVLGLTAAHDRGDLARAVVEGIALDLDRALTHIAPEAEALVASGKGSESELWLRVLAATTSRRVEYRSCPEGASAGACRLAALATGVPFEIDSFNPRVGRQVPVDEEVKAYRRLRDRMDRVAASVVSLEVAERPEGEQVQGLRRGDGDR